MAERISSWCFSCLGESTPESSFFLAFLLVELRVDRLRTYILDLVMNDGIGIFGELDEDDEGLGINAAFDDGTELELPDVSDGTFSIVLADVLGFVKEIWRMSSAS